MKLDSPASPNAVDEGLPDALPDALDESADDPKQRVDGGPGGGGQRVPLLRRHDAVHVEPVDHVLGAPGVEVVPARQALVHALPRRPLRPPAHLAHEARLGAVLRRGRQEQRVLVHGGELHPPRHGGAARVHVEAARRAPEREAPHGLAADVALAAEEAARGWLREEEEVRVLGVERVVVERRRRQRAELVQLEAARLAHEPLPGAVLPAAHAHEQVREVEPGQPVLRVAEMHHLALSLRPGLDDVLISRLQNIVLRLRRRWQPVAAELPCVHRHAPAPAVHVVASALPLPLAWRLHALSFGSLPLPRPEFWKVIYGNI
jgi:hypothetical protein